LFELVPRPDYILRYAGEVAVEQGDIQDLAALVEVMQRHAIETVVHTVRARFTERIYTGMRANIDGAMAVMQAAHLVGSRRFLFVSTQAVYDFAKATGPIPEDHPFTETDHPYAGSKVACERVLRVFARTYDMEFAILRLAQVYGHAAEGAGDRLGVVLQTAVADALTGRPVEIDPGLFDTNDLVYVKDVGNGILFACERPLKRSIYNFGSGRVTGPAEVAEAIRNVAPGVPVTVAAEPAGGFRWGHTNPLDITHAREDFGYEPQYDINKGVTDTVSELKHG
jgi:nucleoside-diphosphate-sugar epimerase